MDEIIMISEYLWSPDPETNRCTSAGAFYLIARDFLEIHKGKAAVYGCAWDDQLIAHHIRVECLNDLTKLQGSKYVQSNTVGVYKLLLEDLRKGIYVLFSGTACQTAAAKKVAGELDEYLYTIDVLCHGVPSPKFWRYYVQRLESRYGGNITDVSFRNKSKTNRMGYYLKFKCNGKERLIFPNESKYYQAFLESYSLRPSCYVCPFVGTYKGSDITLADSNNKDFHPTEAITLVIQRTDKGRLLLETISNKCEVVKANIDDDSIYNKKLLKRTSRPQYRDLFYYEIYDNLDKAVSNKTLLVNRFKNMIPTALKDKIRSN